MMHEVRLLFSIYLPEFVQRPQFLHGRKAVSLESHGDVPKAFIANLLGITVGDGGHDDFIPTLQSGPGYGQRMAPEETIFAGQKQELRASAESIAVMVLFVLRGD
jgi:hypothetical protein